VFLFFPGLMSCCHYSRLLKYYLHICVCCGTTRFSVITLRNSIIHVGNRGISIRYFAHLYTVSSILLRPCYQLFSFSRLSDAAYCSIPLTQVVDNLFNIAYGLHHGWTMATCLGVASSCISLHVACHSNYMYNS